MRYFRFAILILLCFIIIADAAAQEIDNKGYKTIELTNGYEVVGTLIEQTADSTIISVGGSRLAYSNSVVKKISDATNYEEQQAKRTKKKKKKSGLDTLELNIKVVGITDQAFNSLPGYGGQISLALPMIQNRLRLEFGLGAQYFTLLRKGDVTFGYFDQKYSTNYISELTVLPVNIDVGVSYDFLSKSKKSGLSVYLGGSILIPIVKEYEFVDAFSTNDDVFNEEMGALFFSGVKVGVEYSLKIGNGSALTFGYTFSYLEGSTLPVTSEFYTAPSGADYTFKSTLGGLHGFSIGYRHSISLVKKKKKEED